MRNLKHSFGAFGLAAAFLFFASIFFHGCLVWVESAEGAEPPNRANLTLTTNGVLTWPINFFYLNRVAASNDWAATFTPSNTTYNIAAAQNGISNRVVNTEAVTNALGTAAFTAASAYATAAQGAKADTALQPSAIGVSVQAQSSTLDSWAATPTNAIPRGVTASGNAAATTNGQGVVNIAVSGGGGGKVVGWNITTFTNADSTANPIPIDDTKPQSSEGKEYGTVSYTPVASGNTILVKITGWMSASTTGQAVAALFLDSETDARSTTATTVESANRIRPFTLACKYETTGTSALTWKLRFGASTGTGYMIGASASLFAESDFVTVEVIEFTP